MRYALAVAAAVVVSMLPCRAAEPDAAKPWRFVSIPDFLNVDVKYPEPTWEDALGYVLKAIRAEKPDFVLVAGDLVMGRWWKGREQIEKLGKLYYGAWVRRMRDHGLKFYAAVGDHELGDNPWPPKKAALVPHLEAAFVKHLKMPQNGPPHLKGLAYSVVHKGCLFVALDVLEKDARKGIRVKVTGAQLEWLEKTLAEHKGADFVVVMGHTPILGPVRARASSRLMLEGGRDSPLWQTMRKHGVDLYLCGEVHAITCTEADGVEQIAHGSLFGYVTTVNYLVATVEGKRMHLELKRLPIVLEGGRLPQSAGNRPRAIVRIAPEEKRRGFRTVGTMTVDHTGGTRRLIERTGEFAAAYVPPPSRRSKPRGRLKPDPAAVAARIQQLTATAPAGHTLAAYLDCGPQTRSGTAGPVTLALTRGRPYAFPRPEAAKELLPTQATVAFDAAEVVLELRGLRADGRYRVGLSWWDYGGKGRTQSVAVALPDGKPQQVVAPTRLPKWVGDGKLPAEVVFELPPALCRSGAVRLHVRKERGANAVLGEAWVWRSQ